MLGAGAGELDGAGDEEGAGAGEVLLPPLLAAPSDIHHPPLSDIQWYPPGQEPDEEVDPPGALSLAASLMQ